MLRSVRFDCCCLDLQSVASFVDETARLSVEELGRARSQLSVDDAYTLLHFADRESAAAVRGPEAQAAERAIDALCLVDRDAIDYRDLGLDFPLFCGSARWRFGRAGY